MSDPTQPRAESAGRGDAPPGGARNCMRGIDLRGRRPDDYRDVVPRADFDIEAAIPAVHAICEAVRTRGLEAILEMSQRYDGVTQTDIRVAPQALADALANLDPDIRAGLEES